MSLPKEVEAVLPDDPYSQLELANRIVHFAVHKKITQLENENKLLNESLISKQNSIKNLELHVTNLEFEVEDLQRKNAQSIDEQQRLQAEKLSLSETVKKLTKEVNKLESFRRSLLQSLQEDEDIRVHDSESAVPHVPTEGTSNLWAPSASQSSSVPRPSTAYARQPYQGSTPAPFSMPPRKSSYTSSPTRPMTSFSPARSTYTSPPKMDGKEFFRLARSRLSYEHFNQFLQGIKDLNASKQTREETLRRARDIFGAANIDLYRTFETLLTRGSNSF